MRLAQFATLGMALAVVACPGPTAPRVRGISQEGGGSTDVLAFTVQPAGAAAGDIITPAIQVAARDTLGNADTGFTGTVTVVLGTNTVGARLGGTTSVAAVAGVARFGDLTIDRAGTYTLAASAFGATAVTSASFNISPALSSVAIR